MDVIQIFKKCTDVENFMDKGMSVQYSGRQQVKVVNDGFKHY